MALNITTLAVRWGDIFGGINEANTFSGTTVAARANNISADYLTVAAQGGVIDDLYTQAANVRGDLGDWNGYLFGLVQTTLQAMCRDDSARPRTDDPSGWFNKLNRDMQGGTETFSRPEPAITLAVPAIPGTNVGTGYLISSTVEPVDGLGCYYSYAEVIRVECVSDSYSGATDVGAEVFSVVGETAVDKTAYNWPKGSGADTSLTTVNTDTDQILTDGGLELWTGSTNVPTDWPLFGSTTAGTNIYKEATNILGDGGVAAAKFAGDGATVVGIYQTLDQTVVLSNTNYAVSFWYLTPASSNLSTASLRVALVDSGGTPISDNLPAQTITGTTNSNTSVTALTSTNGLAVGMTVTGTGIASNTTIAAIVSSTAITLSKSATASATVSLTFTNYQLSLLSTTTLNASNGTWTRATAVLRTPRSLPSVLRLEFRFPTGNVLDATSSTKIVYLDHVIMSAMGQVYAGGPYLAMHAGATAFAVGDAFTATNAISYYNSGTATTSFVRCLDRDFNLADGGIRLQTKNFNSTPSQIDGVGGGSLIV